mmetsp:Transcript_30201/g.92374  ORF Transcript_30201/g.92374 Transcript_30201/m.92374 type:complete len:444 (+) Transcript_30201:1352-2683(+)
MGVGPRRLRLARWAARPPQRSDCLQSAEESPRGHRLGRGVLRLYGRRAHFGLHLRVLRVSRPRRQRSLRHVGSHRAVLGDAEPVLRARHLRRGVPGRGHQTGARRRPRQRGRGRGLFPRSKRHARLPRQRREDARSHRRPGLAALRRHRQVRHDDQGPSLLKNRRPHQRTSHHGRRRERRARAHRRLAQNETRRLGERRRRRRRPPQVPFRAFDAQAAPARRHLRRRARRRRRRRRPRLHVRDASQVQPPLDRRHPSRPRRLQRQRRRLPGPEDPALRHPAPRLHPSHRRAHSHPQAQALRRRHQVRHDLEPHLQHQHLRRLVRLVAGLLRFASSSLDRGHFFVLTSRSSRSPLLLRPLCQCVVLIAYEHLRPVGFTVNDTHAIYDATFSSRFFFFFRLTTTAALLPPRAGDDSLRRRATTAQRRSFAAATLTCLLFLEDKEL